MSMINFINRSPESGKSSPKLVSEEISLMSVNDEFNQYIEYYMELIRMKSKGMVLIVEDDFFCLRTIVNAIREYSREISIYTADTEKQALKILESTPCDLIIADYYLEGDGTGLELCQKVLAKYAKTKCVMMSNMSFFRYKEIASALESSPEFMEKPVTPSLIKKYLTSFFEDHE